MNRVVFITKGQYVRLDEKKPGDAVKLIVFRDGRQSEITATLRPAS